VAPAPTEIGRVRHVLGSSVTVELDRELAGVAPIYRGRLHHVGQIGSLVRIPQGGIDLIASVSLIGIAELAGPVDPAETIQAVGDRWLRVELIGEIDTATERFQRGVGNYPGLDDPVHFTTPEQLRAVYPAPGDAHLRLGRLAAAEDVPVCLDANRLVVRHGAIVGSTGSGKTSATAALLQGFIRGGWRAANIVVIDPHGEYSDALEASASVRSVLGEDESALRVPYWALGADEILRAFAGSTGGKTTIDRFRELVAQARRRFASDATWLELDPIAVTEDTPIPFDLRSVWLDLETENRQTLITPGDPSTECLETPGDARRLRPPVFTPYGPGGAPPQKGPYHGVHGTIPELLRLGLSNPRLAFLQEPSGDPDGEDPLLDVVGEWIGQDKPVSVLDFSGVPDGAADLAIGVVLNLLFEVAIRSETDGIGRPSPVLVVLEEAHRYLGEGASSLTRHSANKIAREGRKYGVGLLLVTQRPSELPDTALAQCGTLIALRLSNQSDQGTIRAALPDTVSGLAAVLPSLRTGEAIVSGEAVVVPARVLVDLPEPMPRAEDPSLAPWRAAPSVPDVRQAISAWRGIYDSD
jgi:hypothetical protein